MGSNDNVDLTLDPLDAAAFEQLDGVTSQIPPVEVTVPHRALPAKVDLGRHLHYIRRQGGSGCFAFALLAVWDIMNEMACPYSPNLAVAPWMFLHRRRDIWQQDQGWASKTGGVVTRDGRFIPFAVGPEYGLFQEYGNPTEGTELPGYTAQPWCGLTSVDIGSTTVEKITAIGWTVEGVNEADQYRLADWPKPLAKVTSAALIEQLAAGRPLRATIPSHYVAIVGYDMATRRFTYVDSKGDRGHSGGFGTYTFAQIDSVHNPIVSKAEIISIVPPRPVPAVRVKFSHTNRMNVALWLSVEGSPLPRRQIWPPPQFHDDLQDSRHSGRWNSWDENSDNLHFTVRAPTELMWPPDQGNRLVLDLFDCGAHTTTGGQLEEYTAAFGGHVMTCNALQSGPVRFDAFTHHTFRIG